MEVIAYLVELFVVKSNCSDVCKLFLFIKFIILSFSTCLHISKNIFRRDIDRKLPSLLGAAVLAIGIALLILKSSKNHSFKHLWYNLIQTGIKTTLAIFINFGGMPLGPGAEFVLLLLIA